MNFKQQIIIRGIGGSLIGIFLSYMAITLAAAGTGQVTLGFKGLLIQGLVSIVIGFYSAAGTIVYNIERWSLLKQTTVHFLLLSMYLPVAYVMGWMPRNILGIGVFVGIFLAFYIIQWTIFYQIWKRRVAALNEEIKRFHVGKAVE